MSRPGVSVDVSSVLLVLALAGLGLWIVAKGGLRQAAQALGAGLVGTAGGVVAGGVGAVSAAFGLPGPGQTTTDAAVARWIIDNRGIMAASRWAGVPALASAAVMPAGSGRPPALESDAARALGVVRPTTGDFSRMDRREVLPDSTEGPWRMDLPGGDVFPW